MKKNQHSFFYSLQSSKKSFTQPERELSSCIAAGSKVSHFACCFLSLSFRVPGLVVVYCSSGGLEGGTQSLDGFGPAAIKAGFILCIDRSVKLFRSREEEEGAFYFHLEQSRFCLHASLIAK